jgi:hypothetical protein
VPIIFSIALGDPLHLLCVHYDRLLPQLGEQPAYPGGMCSDFQGDETWQYLSKALLHRFRFHPQFLFQNDLPCFLQNTVERRAISEVPTSLGLTAVTTKRRNQRNCLRILIQNFAKPLPETIRNHAKTVYGHGGAGESRTPDLRFRKPPLYPSELQPRNRYLVSLHPFLRKKPNIPSPATPRNRSQKNCAPIARPNNSNTPLEYPRVQLRLDDSYAIEL